MARWAGISLVCLALGAIAVPATAAASDGAKASIIGGHPGSIAEFPAITYIEAHEGDHGFSCTGTVVAPRVVLTAAHCVESIEEGTITAPGDYAVATGVADPTKAGPTNISRIAEAHVFPGFDPGSLHGDAAILILSTPSPAAPIALAGAADAPLYAGGTPVQLGGWGLTKPTAGDIPHNFNATTMTEQAPSFCKSHTRAFNSEYSPAAQFCTLQPPQKATGSCFGDSGGPAIGIRADGTAVQLGIISSGAPLCNTKKPNILTRTDLVSGWVAEWIAAIEAGAPRPVVDPHAPFPTLTRRSAEEFTAYTLINGFGKRFEGASRVFGQCKRASLTRFRCNIVWFQGPTVYAGTVSPFYIRRQGALAWDSHFRIEWAPARCIEAHRPHCPIHTKHG